jgi:hypothetical protein
VFPHFTIPENCNIGLPRKAIVWNMKKTEEDADHVHHFSLTERCSCQTRMQQLIQYGHELHVFGFKLPLWNHRWYNTPTYCRDVHNLFERGFFRPSSTSSREEKDDPYEEEQDFGTFETSDETTAEMVGLVTRRRVFFLPTQDDDGSCDDVPTLTYSEIVGTLNSIVSHVQNDQVKMIELQAFAQGVLDSYRRGLEVHYEYTTTGTPSGFLTATSQVNTTASREKR